MSLSVNDLPNEIKHMILKLLDDKDALNAINALDFAMPEIHKKQRIWTKSSFTKLAGSGDLEGLK
jgi:hypothetical protein